MARFWFACALAVVCAGMARGQVIALNRVDGGGALAANANTHLIGSIGGYGLSGGVNGRSSSASYNLWVGYYPPLVAQMLLPWNGADPAWIELGMLLEKEPENWRRIADARQAAFAALRAMAELKG